MAAVINLDTVRLTRTTEDMPPREFMEAEIILFPGIRYERWDVDQGSCDVVDNDTGKEQRRLSQD